jgi:NADH:ubiquinone oxidoreductase subunit E
MSRIGVFICWCGSNIAETVDSPAVAKYAATIPGVVVSQDYKYTCSDPGQKMITDAITEQNLSGVVVASCSPRMHESTFRSTAASVGLNPYLVEMANIREHCSWVHHDKMSATEKAKVLVRMTIERVKRNHKLQPIKVPVTDKAMVVGGGIAGIQAALDIAKSGKEVVLVEKQPSIGGFMSKLDETFPTLDCSQCILTPRMVEIMQSKNITLHSYSEVEKVEGYIGNFEVTVRKKDRGVDIDKCTGCGDCWNNCMARNKLHVPEKTVSSGILSADKQTEVDEILSNFPNSSSIIIPLLLSIQDKYNYLPGDVMKYVSLEKEIPLSKMYSVATFYHAFSLKPRGRHIIRVCTGTACHLKGADLITDEICSKLDIKDGETTKDLRFTLNSVRCLGCCSIAPAVMINDKVYGHVKAREINNILEDYS